MTPNYDSKQGFSSNFRPNNELINNMQLCLKKPCGRRYTTKKGKRKKEKKETIKWWGRKSHMLTTAQGLGVGGHRLDCQFG